MIDALNSINQTKVNLIRTAADPSVEERSFPVFPVLRSLSYHQDILFLVNELQRRGTNGAIGADALDNEAGGDIDTLVGYLKDKSFRDVRKWVATTPNLDLPAICRELYNRMYELCVPNDMPQLVLFLSEYQYKAAFVSDQEINTMALMVEIMMQVNFK